MTPTTTSGAGFGPRAGRLRARYVVDLRAADDLERASAYAAELGRRSMVALFGEHVDDEGLSPRSTAERAARVGIPSIVTITGRARTAHDAAAELAGVLTHDPVGVLCVTGDHPRARFPDAGHVAFGTEGTLLASRARREGASCVLVGESPGSGSHSLRANRLAAKADAGADLAVLNHAGDVDELDSFAEIVRRSGNPIELVAPVPVITSREAALRLMAFPGLRLPTGCLERIAADRDPHRGGVRLAAELSAQLLTRPYFVGVNLSGGAGLDTVERIETYLEIADLVRLRPAGG